MTDTTPNALCKCTIPGKNPFHCIHMPWCEALSTQTLRITELTEALRYTAFYGSSVPLGMSAEDYYHGAMNDLISHAARALPSETGE